MDKFAQYLIIVVTITYERYNTLKCEYINTDNVYSGQFEQSLLKQNSPAHVDR